MSRETAESLFERFFLPLYPKGVDFARVRNEDANPAGNPALVQGLADAARIFSEMAVALFGLEAPLDFTDESVHRLSRALTKERRDRWSATPGSAERPAELAQVIIHGTAYLGEVVVRNHGGVWRLRSPLWESRVFLKTAQGEGELALFQWWLKSLSDDGLDESLGTSLSDRFRMYVENPNAEPKDLAPFVDKDRRLPRLAKVRYDLLYKHLRAHLPELRDVGKDFPSPERFDELELKGLDFLLVGDGRMLVLSGLGKNGLHLFWLDPKGFQKGAFIPCDSFPAPIVRTEDEKVAIDFSRSGLSTRQEFLWWGP